MRSNCVVLRWLGVVTVALASLLSGCGGASGSHSLPEVGSRSAGSLSATSGIARSSDNPLDPYEARILQDSPAAFFPMSDTSNVLNDDGPNRLRGSYGAAVRLDAATFPARSGSAPSFPGGSQYNATGVADVPVTSSLQPSQLTIEAWITPSSTNASGFFKPIVAYGSEGAGNPYILQISPQNTLNFWTKGSSQAGQVQGTTFFLPGETYHVVATDTGGQLSLYVNGKLDGTASGPGAPAYTYLDNYGLTIGGAPDSLNRSMVAGAIDDVAIYSTALSANTIAAHYALGSTSTWPYENEVPHSADGFVDSFGVVIHLHYQDSPYDLQFENVKALLSELGVRHIRDGLYTDGWQPYKDRLEELAQVGIHSTLDAPANTTAAQVVGYPSLIPGSMEAVVGYNEPDISGNPNWIADTRAWQQLLYQTVKSSGATANLAVLGPSVVTSEAAGALGDMSQWMDYGDSHVYLTGRNPENPGFGGTYQWGTYGSLNYTLGYETVMSGSRPQRITETGWGTLANGFHDVSPLTQAKYLARLYLDLYGRGIDRSLMYEFVDGQDGDFGWFGLVDYYLNRKPSFYEMKSLLGLLSDSGSTYSPSTKFGFHFTGNTSNLDHLLLQKRDGRHYLAFWIGVQSCDPTVPFCADQPVPPQQITLLTQLNPSAATLYTLDANGHMSAQKIGFSNNATTLTATDQVSVIELDP